jgi:integrase
MQPTNNNGSIVIRFTKFGYKYSLTNLGKFDDSTAYREAMSICESIQVDIRLGRFSPKSNDELFTKYHPLASLSSHHEANKGAVDCLETVEETLASKSLRDRNLHQTKNFLVKYGKPIRSSVDALKFWQWLQLTSNGNARTINRHLDSLKPICTYFRDIPKLKTAQVKGEKPFTKGEIKAIVQTFDEHFQHYSPFIKFLFSTGCRPNEAVALKWKDVDFENKQITICEAVSIANDGSKVSKETKTGVVRSVPMSDKIYGLLIEQGAVKVQKSDDALVFPTPTGAFIDIRNFRARVWVKALELSKVPYRKLYNTKHSFCSHFLSENPDFVQLASITHGTKSGVATLQRHYAHVVNKPDMPDMF